MSTAQRTSMKRWFAVAVFILAALFASNLWFSYRLRIGLREVAERLKAGDPADSRILYPVGPTTSEALMAVTKDDYSVSVRLFDGMGESLSVTHTAVVESRSGKIGIRARLNLLEFRFRVVGFYSVR